MFALKQHISFQCPEDPLCFKVDTAFCLLQKVLLERFWVGNLTDVLANFTKISCQAAWQNACSILAWWRKFRIYIAYLWKAGWKSLDKIPNSQIPCSTKDKIFFHRHNSFDNFLHLEGFFENNYFPGYFWNSRQVRVKGRREWNAFENSEDKLSQQKPVFTKPSEESYFLKQNLKPHKSLPKGTAII